MNNQIWQKVDPPRTERAIGCKCEEGCQWPSAEIQGTPSSGWKVFVSYFPWLYS